MDVTLDYPSGQRHKKVPSSVTGIVKNLVMGKFRAGVHLMFKCKELQPFILDAFRSSVSNELKEYCRADNSLLKHTSPAELAAFSNKLVCHEISVMCPMFDSAIRAAAGCHRSKTKSDKAVNVLALCSAALAKFRNSRMSALAYRISVILLHSGAKSQDFTRLNHLGICMSHDATIGKQKEMSREHDSLILSWKSDIQEAKNCERLLREVKDKQVPSPAESRDERDMDIDVYNLGQSALEGYTHFSMSSLEKCVKEIETPLPTPAVLDDAIKSASKKFKSIPRYR